MTWAAVFPGQGSQSVGMLADLAADFPVVAETFAEASAVLGYDLWRLTQDGPAEALGRTDCTQPAMLAAGVAVWRAWRGQGGGEPAVMAGHSLGEYTALVCAGAMDFAAAVDLVAARGRFMQEAVPPGTGAMAAVLGLADAAVAEVCAAAAGDQVVAPVNFNAPGQVVIAGHAEAVARAAAAAKAAGAKRVMDLPVSVPSHCALMEPAAERLAARLAAVAVRAPSIPVVHNADLARHQGAEDLRAALVRQLHSPVRWSETIVGMRTEGLSAVVELGPGKVLAGLCKRIDRDLAAWPVQDGESLAAALAGVSGSDDHA